MKQHLSDAAAWRLRPPVFIAMASGGLLVAIMLRLFFILKYPVEIIDSFYYEQLADNWLYHHTYGLFIHGILVAADIRMPGYPAFLDGVTLIFGRQMLAVRLIQCLVDVCSCIIAGALAWRIAPRQNRERAFVAGLWLAGLCPFTANYTAAILTETLATFFTVSALLVLVLAQQRLGAHLNATPRGALHPAALWLTGGVLAGLGALVRPETPIVLVPFLVLLLWRSFRARSFKQLVLCTTWASVGLLVCLTPWATRNAITMGRIRFLAPRYANSAGDYVPVGFYSWTKTWLVRSRDNYLFPWKLYGGRISPGDLPASATDSGAEKALVISLLQNYDDTGQMTPATDHTFALLARERTHRNPFRTYMWVPLRRVFTMWFTPRLELLPVRCEFLPEKGVPWPQQESFLFTVTLELAAIAYAALGLAGAWRRRHNAIALALFAYIAMRTLLMTQLQTVEPRYVVECFPVIAAFAANAFFPASGCADPAATVAGQKKSTV